MARIFSPDLTLSPWSESVHAPFVGLINPKSGGQKGEPILQVCLRSDYYKDRIFNILHVNKGGEAFDTFRKRLFEAKELASKKQDPRFRPRLICGGGDGTASFALMLTFKALLAEDQKNFVWSDEDMAMFFPALVQMPLGTGNDLGGILGWGRKYPGYTRRPCSQMAAHSKGLVRWMGDALNVNLSTVVNFDVWGYMPAPGEEAMDVKVCELAEVQKNIGKDIYVFKPASPVVPFLVFLYSSFGFSAKVVARFQLARHESQLENMKEYIKIGTALMMKGEPACVKPGMTGMRIEELDGKQYFPPANKRTDSNYLEIGFLNINSYSAGVITGKDRAKTFRRWCLCGLGRRPVQYGDGLCDFYRESQPRTVMKHGTVLQTDKKPGGTFFNAAGEGTGRFLQYDGEGRFVFHPEGKAWRMDVRHVMTAPIVVRGKKKSTNEGAVRFCIGGEGVSEQEVKARILKWVNGDLIQELNATAVDIKNVGLSVHAEFDQQDTSHSPQQAQETVKRDEQCISPAQDLPPLVLPALDSVPTQPPSSRIAYEKWV